MSRCYSQIILTDRRRLHQLVERKVPINEMARHSLRKFKSCQDRVERMNRTLQDRLVKALRLAGIDNMAAGNAFLSSFMSRYNARFSIVPARSDDLHRPH